MSPFPSIIYRCFLTLSTKKSALINQGCKDKTYLFTTFIVTKNKRQNASVKIRVECEKYEKVPAPIQVRAIIRTS